MKALYYCLLVFTAFTACTKDQTFSDADLKTHKIYEKGDTFKMLNSKDKDTLSFLVTDVVVNKQNLPKETGGSTDFEKIVSIFSVQKNAIEIGSGEMSISSLSNGNYVDIHFTIEPCGSYHATVNFSGTDTLTAAGKLYTNVASSGGVFFSKDYGILKMAGCSVLELIN